MQSKNNDYIFFCPWLIRGKQGASALPPPSGMQHRTCHAGDTFSLFSLSDSVSLLWILNTSRDVNRTGVEKDTEEGTDVFLLYYFLSAVDMLGPKCAIYQFWKWHSHFQYWHPFPVHTVLFWIPLLEIFHLVRYPNQQSAITGTGRDSFRTIYGTGLFQFRCGRCWGWGPVPELDSMRVVPFPVLGYAISGTVIVRVRTRTGLYVCGPISGTGLCHFLYGPSLNFCLNRAALF